MSGRRAQQVEELRGAVLAGPGQTDGALRQAVAARAAELGRAGEASTAVPADLAGYVDKVALHAYKVVDEDIEALKAAGYSEDQIFELTVSAAVGAGLDRRQQGMAALGRGRVA
ncbi:MAG: hypothetical protein ACE5EV_04515 [Gaiellales bacterium]